MPTSAQVLAGLEADGFIETVHLYSALGPDGIVCRRWRTTERRARDYANRYCTHWTLLVCSDGRIVERRDGTGWEMRAYDQYLLDTAEPWADCPDHGRQHVVGASSTGGPDPWSVDHLACGCRVLDMGGAADGSTAQVVGTWTGSGRYTRTGEAF